MTYLGQSGYGIICELVHAQGDIKLNLRVFNIRNLDVILVASVKVGRIGSSVDLVKRLTGSTKIMIHTPLASQGAASRTSLKSLKSVSGHLTDQGRNLKGAYSGLDRITEFLVRGRGGKERFSTSLEALAS